MAQEQNFCVDELLTTLNNPKEFNQKEFEKKFNKLAKKTNEYMQKMCINKINADNMMKKKEVDPFSHKSKDTTKTNHREYKQNQNIFNDAPRLESQGYSRQDHKKKEAPIQRINTNFKKNAEKKVKKVVLPGLKKTGIKHFLSFKYKQPSFKQ